jgi:protein O-mannosyl-transferase
MRHHFSKEVRFRAILAASLLVLTVATFWKVSQNGFVGYDDPDYLTSNDIIKRGISKSGLVWAFSKLHGEQTYWHPITWLSHMADVQLFGMNPGAHHLVSLVVHCATVLLLFVLLQTMTGALWRSALVASLFAIHPLQVESVAWATERKNVLSTFFFVLTLCFYVRYTRFPTIWRYLVSLLTFGIGLMCKPAIVPLPGVLMLLDYWPLRRFTLTFARPFVVSSKEGTSNIVPTSAKWLILEKLPFAALAIASSLLTLSAHRGLGMLQDASAPPPNLQWANVLLSYVRYIGKTLWPTDLAVFYPYPTSIPIDVTIVCGLLLITVTAACLWQLRKRPYLAVGWLWFLGVSIPTIGLIPVGLQAMADRFAYVPVAGLFVAAAWGLADLVKRFHVPTILVALLSGTSIAALASASFKQVDYWKNDYTLFERARTATHNNFMAYTAVGGVLLRQGQFEEAMRYFTIAQSIEPGFPDTYFSLGVAMYMRSNLEGAITNFQHALQLRSDYPEARLNLALALQTSGRLNESIENYRLFLRIRPHFAQAHFTVANLLLTSGRTVEATDHLREVIRLDPKSSGAMARLAWILATHSDSSLRNGLEAIRLAKEACELTKYQHVQTVNTLAAAYAETERFDLAVRTAEQALDLAKSKGEINLLPIIEDLRDRYRRREPYRE